MRKLNNIEKVEILENCVVFDGIPMHIGEDIESWMNMYLNVGYIFEQYSMINFNARSYEFLGINGITIRADITTVSDIAVYIYT